MRTLHIRPQARLDLLEIWHHIAKHDVAAASRVAGELDRAIRGLLQMPGKGHYRADVAGTRYKFWGVYSYVIGYRYDDASLTIVRVVHGRRDFRQLFRGNP